ncbi:hypothetical protein GTO10_02515 [Candidatus Saccharibacteria bacterium]|nr:hypothetical protein [Candidatus Saccharibacteria bacterium]
MNNTLLLVIIALLTVNILFVGLYIVLVLKEIRQSVMKVNRILDSLSSISSAIASPVSQAPGVISAVVEGIKAVKSIQDSLTKKKKVEVLSEAEDEGTT